jgi:hypothetical protein
LARAISSLAAVALLAAGAARADIPPPPYTGPTHATLAGLDFERGEGVRPPGRPGRRTYAVVTLKGCRGRSRNCAAVTRAGVMGWGVVKVDGQWVSYGDVAELTRAFAGARRGPLRVVFQDVGGAADPRQVEVTLDPR